MRSVWVVTELKERLILAIAASRTAAQRAANDDNDLWAAPLVWTEDSLAPHVMVDTTFTYRIMRYRVASRWRPWW